jgi:hypothetical protein
MRFTVSDMYPSELETPFGPATVEHRQIATIEVRTPSIVVRDPFIIGPAARVELDIAEGSYPVTAVIARFPAEERVAAMYISFSSAAATTWQYARGRDDEALVYGVDTGTASFMDLDASDDLTAEMQKSGEEAVTLPHGAAMDANSRDHWSWTTFEPNKFSESNAVAISSGFGDGVFSVFVGRDDSDGVACVLTDFRVLGDLTLSDEP